MEQAAGSMVWMILKTFGLLVVIIALIILTLNVMRRFIRPGGGSGRTSDSLKVIGTLFLEPKKGIYLVKVVDRLLILGVTDGSISFLEKVPEGPEMERMVQAFNGSKALFPQQFSEKLRLALKKRNPA